MQSAKIIQFICTITLIFSCIGARSVYAEETNGDLTDKLDSRQQQWLKNQKDDVIKVAVGSESARFFNNTEGEWDGYVYHLFVDLAAETGLKFEFNIGEWQELVRKLSHNEVDLLVGTMDDKDSIIGAHISEPLHSKPYWICSYEDFQSIHDLEYKNIGFLSESGTYSAFDKAYSLDVSPVLLPDEDSLFKALGDDSADAIMVSECLKVNKLLKDYNVERNFMVREMQQEIRVSGHEEQKVLLDIIDVYIEENESYYSQILLDSNNEFMKKNIAITQEEARYLDEIDELRVGYLVNFLPFDYAAAGDMKGISAELIKTLSSVLSVPVRYIAYESASQMKRDLIEGNLHIITSYGTYYDYGSSTTIVSKVYSSSDFGVVGHKNNQLLPYKLHDLNGSRIALIRDSWQEHMLISNGIQYDAVYIDSIHEAMSAVNSDQADYVIENMWTISFLMLEMSYDNLRPSGDMDIADARRLLFNREDVRLRDLSNRVIDFVNLKDIESKGLYENYQIQSTYEFYEVLTVTLFLLLCFIGIYIAFLINRLNVERQKAESANRSKSEFLAKMSHEIRTPLTAIMGYINLLSRSENINGKEKQQLKIAYNSSNILIHLVNDILDFSKIEAGKVSLVVQDFNLRLMINNAINIIGVMAEEKQLDFVVKLHHNLPRFVSGDERRLEQILINILSNSVKFTDHGMVELIISPEYYEDKVRLNFTVRDTGKGMKPETINMIFDAFEQEDNSISRRYGGTGLGLYISKDFIERMGGKIKVNSDVGKGTEFSFYTIHELAKEIAEVDELSTSLTISELEGMKVLLVEDNDINQMIIRDILVDMGLKVIITSNGAEALEVVNPGFDFVLMDIQMPVMNGLMAVKVMKYREELQGVPVIALTANVMPEQIDSYYREGFDAYCSKPIMVNELGQTLIQMYEKFHIDDR